ncbi:MAG: hypothetical protein PHX04_05245 [Bacilli bacterium]|nr:hypothetical protein [Bacilli bacterium]
MKKSKNAEENKEANCFNCDNCLYIGEGDYICEAMEKPVIVITEYQPYKYFNFCKKKKWEIGNL